VPAGVLDVDGRELGRRVARPRGPALSGSYLSLDSPQNVTISKNNLGDEGWAAVLAAVTASTG
jgi:hypothetical protein